MTNGDIIFKLYPKEIVLNALYSCDTRLFNELIEAMKKEFANDICYMIRKQYAKAIELKNKLDDNPFTKLPKYNLYEQVTTVGKRDVLKKARKDNDGHRVSD